MGPIQKRKNYRKGDTHLARRWALKRRTRDLDQIDGDMAEGVVEKHLKQKVDFVKPGLAQFYCVHCAKHFINGAAFKTHCKQKPHKRRMHALKTEPYTIEESLRAAGQGSYIKPKQRKMTTLIPEAVAKEETLEQIKLRALEEGTVEGKPAVVAPLDKVKDADGDVKM